MAKANVFAKVVKRPSGKRIWNTWSWKCHALPCLLKPDKMHPWIVVYISHEQMRRNMNMKINPTRCSDPKTYSHVLSPPELWKSILSPTASCGNRSWKGKGAKARDWKMWRRGGGIGLAIVQPGYVVVLFWFHMFILPMIFSIFSIFFVHEMHGWAGWLAGEGQRKGQRKGQRQVCKEKEAEKRGAGPPFWGPGSVYINGMIDSLPTFDLRGKEVQI